MAVETYVVFPRRELEALKMKISGGLCYVGAQAKHAQLKDAEKIVDDLLALPPTDLSDQELPCDVRLPPVTTIRKGVKVSTLMTAIRQRTTYDEKDLAFTDLSGDWNAAINKAMTAVDNMRSHEAGLFDEAHSGAKGESRSNALYDAYAAIKALLRPKPTDKLVDALKACGVDE